MMIKIRQARATEMMTSSHRLQKNLRQSSGRGKSRGLVGGFSLLVRSVRGTETLESELPDKHTLRYESLRYDTVLSHRLAVIFISCKPPVEPVKLVLKHLENIRETGTTQTRYGIGFLYIHPPLKKKQIHLEAHACLELLQHRSFGNQEPRPKDDGRIHFAAR